MPSLLPCSIFSLFDTSANWLLSSKLPSTLDLTIPLHWDSGVAGRVLPSLVHQWPTKPYRGIYCLALSTKYACICGWVVSDMPCGTNSSSKCKLSSDFISSLIALKWLFSILNEQHFFCMKDLDSLFISSRLNMYKSHSTVKEKCSLHLS